jgi:branched-chain amino acid aminotransferase
LQHAIGDGIQIDVVERPFTMADLFEAHHQGKIIEAFVTGTALFITPVGVIRSDQQDLEINCSPVKGISCSQMIKEWLIGIMSGKEEHEWTLRVDAA